MLLGVIFVKFNFSTLLKTGCCFSFSVAQSIIHNSGAPGAASAPPPTRLQPSHHPTHILKERGFPDGSDGKEFACSVGDLGSIPGWGRSGEGNGNPTPVFLPGKPQGRRSLAGPVHGVTKSWTRLGDFTLKENQALECKLLGCSHHIKLTL